MTTVMTAISVYLSHRKHVKWQNSYGWWHWIKCGVMGSPAYDVVHVQGSAGDGLEPDRWGSNQMTDTTTRQKQQLVLVCMRLWQCGFVRKRELINFSFLSPCFPSIHTCLHTGICIPLPSSIGWENSQCSPFSIVCVQRKQRLMWDYSQKRIFYVVCMTLVECSWTEYTHFICWISRDSRNNICFCFIPI